MKKEERKSNIIILLLIISIILNIIPAICLNYYSFTSVTLHILFSIFSVKSLMPTLLPAV